MGSKFFPLRVDPFSEGMQNNLDGVASSENVSIPCLGPFLVASAKLQPDLTLLLLNTTCPVLANSVDPDQLASEEAN